MLFFDLTILLNEKIEIFSGEIHKTILHLQQKQHRNNTESYTRILTRKQLYLYNTANKKTNR